MESNHGKPLGPDYAALKPWWREDLRNLIRGGLCASVDHSSDWKNGFEATLRSFGVSFGLDKNDSLGEMQVHFTDEIGRQLKAVHKLISSSGVSIPEYEKGAESAITFIATSLGLDADEILDKEATASEYVEVDPISLLPRLINK